MQHNGELMRFWSIILIAELLLLGSGCVSPARTAVRTEKPEEKSLPTLAPVLPQIADELVQVMLNAEWLDVFKLLEARSPVILPGTLETNGQEIAGMENYGQQLVASLLRSKAVQLVVNKDDSPMPIILDSAAAAMQLSLDSNADFFLESSIVDSMAYPELQLRLIYLKEYEVVWSETRSLYKIKI